HFDVVDAAAGDGRADTAEGERAQLLLGEAAALLCIAVLNDEQWRNERDGKCDAQRHHRLLIRGTREGTRAGPPRSSAGDQAVTAPAAARRAPAPGRRAPARPRRRPGDRRAAACD